MWRKPISKLFGSHNFFLVLQRRTLPLWAQLVDAWLRLETPKAAMSGLISGRLGRKAGWFAGKADEAEAQAEILRRINFALWAGEFNQYVGALQGMLIHSVVSGFKFGLGSDRANAIRWIVQVKQYSSCAAYHVR